MDAHTFLAICSSSNVFFFFLHCEVYVLTRTDRVLLPGISWTRSTTTTTTSASARRHLNSYSGATTASAMQEAQCLIHTDPKTYDASYHKLFVYGFCLFRESRKVKNTIELTFHLILSLRPQHLVDPQTLRRRSQVGFWRPKRSSVGQIY